jgi:MFS transporter, OFA family, oxalate/formate antiporter
MPVSIIRTGNTRQHLNYGFIIVAVVFLLQVIMIGPRGAYGVFIRPLSLEFDWSYALISGAFAFSNIVMGLSSVAMGWLNDRYGPRWVMTFCGLFIGSGILLVSIMHSWWQLYLFYAVLVGLGMGGLSVPSMSTLTRWFPRHSGFMTSIIMTGAGLGGLFAPPLCNWLVYSKDWRFAFLIVGSYVTVLVVLGAQLLKRDPSPIRPAPEKETGTQGLPAKTANAGLILREALHTRQFWMAVLSMLCYGFTLVTVMVHVVPYAIDAGVSAAGAANILALMSGAMPLGAISIGLIADRIGYRRMLIISFILLFSITGLALPLKSSWSIALFVAAMSLGGGGISTLNPSLVTGLFGMKSHGLMLGIQICGYSVGATAGSFLGGYFYDITGNYRAVFLICGAFCLTGFLMSILLKPQGSLPSKHPSIVPSDAQNP